MICGSMFDMTQRLHSIGFQFRRKHAHLSHPAKKKFGITILVIIATILLYNVMINPLDTVAYALSTTQSEGPSRVLIATSTAICNSKNCRDKEQARRISLQNWKNSGFEVLALIDDEKNCKKLPKIVRCAQHKCHHKVLKLPMVGCMIHDSIEQHSNNIIVFANDDIYFEGLRETIRALELTFDGSFVAFGRRTNVPTEFFIQLINSKETRGGKDLLSSDQIDLFERNFFKTGDEFEMDYFVFKLQASLLDDYPEFLFGNWRWDNVLVDYLVMHNITLVDVSETVTAYHLGKSVKQNARHGAKFNNDLMHEYFRKTADKVTVTEGIKHDVVRFGSMDNAAYFTKRSEDGISFYVASKTGQSV